MPLPDTISIAPSPAQEAADWELKIWQALQIETDTDIAPMLLALARVSKRLTEHLISTETDT